MEKNDQCFMMISMHRTIIYVSNRLKQAGVPPATPILVKLKAEKTVVKTNRRCEVAAFFVEKVDLASFCD